MSAEEVATGVQKDVEVVDVDWWKESQKIRLMSRMQELEPGQSMIVSAQSHYALGIEDVEAVVGHTVGNTFAVFPRFGGCEIVRKRKAR